MSKPPQTRAQKNLRFAFRVAGLLARGFAAMFSLVLLVLLAAYFALPKIVDGDRAKLMLVDQLQRVLQRPVRIDKVILTPQGVKLAGFRVLERTGSAPFIEGDFALVTVKVFALLHKRLELSNVRLASPRIHVSRDEQGRWSVADLFSSTATAKPVDSRPFALPVSLASDQTTIESGRLEIEDNLRGTHHLIERFNLAVQQFDFDQPFSYSLSFDNANSLGQRKVRTSVALEGEISLAGFDWSQAFVNALKAQVKLDGRVLQGSVTISSFTAPVIEADMLAPALGAEDWAWMLNASTSAPSRPVDFSMPPSRWLLKAQLTEPGKLRVDDLRAKAGPFSGRASGRVDWSGPQPALAADVSFDDFPLTDAAGFRQSLDPMQLRGTARGEGSFKGWPGRMTISKAHVSLRDVEAKFKHWRVVKGNADLAATDDLSNLAVTLSSGAVEAYKNGFRDITLSMKLVRQDLRVDYLSLKWENSRLRLRGRIVNLPDPQDVWMSGTLDYLYWDRAQQLVGDVIASISTRTATAPLIGPDTSPKRLWVQTIKYSLPKRFPDTIGHIRINKVLHKTFNFGDMDLLWDLRGVTNKLDTVNGEIRVGFGPGRVEDIQAVQDSNKFLRIVFLPYIYMHKMNSLSVLSAGTAYPKTLDFTRIEGQYGVRRGVVDTRFSGVDSPQLVAYADGTADFGRENVDMNILTRLTTYRSPLPEWWVDERGRPSIGFRVKGDLNRPDLEPRLHKIGAEEIEHAMEDGRRRARARFEALDKLNALDGVVADKKGAKP